MKSLIRCLPFRTLSLALVFVAPVLSSKAYAQTQSVDSSSAEVFSADKLPAEVIAVRFNPVRADGGTWYMAEIEVKARPGVGNGNRMFLNRVKVTLNMGIFSVKAPASAKVPDTYYRASAEAVAIEAAGGRSYFRFYLPPEIVKRDQVTGEQRFYLVELAVDGKPLPLTKYRYSTIVFPKPEMVSDFKAKIDAEAGANDGILLPQHLTPFAYQGSAPSCIRIENSR